MFQIHKTQMKLNLALAPIILLLKYIPNYIFMHEQQKKNFLPDQEGQHNQHFVHNSNFPFL